MIEVGDLVFLGRIALAGFLSFLIGWEREARGSHAGDRTHALVAIATAASLVLESKSSPPKPEG
jgi:putative Mg2+ transporter-C (MgtC) family protein